MRSSALKTVLILEDEPVVAVHMDAMITEAGFHAEPVISSCADALEWLKSNRADFAIIDVELRDGPCHEIAKLLVEKSIPFVVFSGSSPLADIDPIFQKGRWLEKPASGYEVIAAIQSLSGENSDSDLRSDRR